MNHSLQSDFVPTSLKLSAVLPVKYYICIKSAISVEDFGKNCNGSSDKELTKLGIPVI